MTALKTQPILTHTIGYSFDKIEAEGVLVHQQDITRDAPLILVAPDWRGVTATAIDHCRNIAEHGNVVFLLDFFGIGNAPAGTENPIEFLQPYFADPLSAVARVSAGYHAMIEVATSRGIGDPSRTAAVGYCFGGANVLDFARAGGSVAAVVSMHGTLQSSLRSSSGAMKAAVLVIHGADDPISPKEERDALEEELRESGTRWAMLTLGNVYHAFTDPDANSPPVAAYDPKATRYGYLLAQAFLTDTFTSSG